MTRARVRGLRLGYQGAVAYLSESERQEVTAWLRQKNYWHLPELQQHLEESYEVVFKSKQSYYDLFKEAGISWKRTQSSNPWKDPELVEKKTGNYVLTRSAPTRERSIFQSYIGMVYSRNSFRIVVAALKSCPLPVSCAVRVIARGFKHHLSALSQH